MPSVSAKRSIQKSKPKPVLFVVYPGVKLLDLAGPLQVFSDALNDGGGAAYKTSVVSIEGGMIPTDTPIGIPTEPLSSWQRRQIDTLVIVGGNGVFTAVDNQRFISLITKLSKKARRVAAVCTGAFVLAECGFLDGRNAVTHWEACTLLSKSYLKVQVERDSIFVKDDKYWTSAGVTSGIDMSLKMLEEDLGRVAALTIARSLVTYLVRPGGQAQFSQPLMLQIVDGSGRFDELHSWMQNNLTLDLRNQMLADRVNMSIRNFARLYLSETGRTPAKAVEIMRVEAACRILEATSLNVNEIAQRCGFGDDERMRRAFVKHMNTSPNRYRKRFS